MFTIESDRIRVAIIIPSYRETFALPTLLKELGSKLRVEDAVIVVDDSPFSESRIIEKKCMDSLGNSRTKLIFINCGTKTGRGNAVRRGMLIACDQFKNLEYVIECDADGSHRVPDIVKLRDSEQPVDLLIGSRYLPNSQIWGWPLSRRVFSFLLNFLIPRILSIDIKDITNGLRRYSSAAVKKILASPQENSGFIYLSEQALILKKSNSSITEIPIIFTNRIQGDSTVTIHEIIQSVRGIKRIISENWR